MGGWDTINSRATLQSTEECMKTKGILFAGDDSMLSEPVGGTDKAHFFFGYQMLLRWKSHARCRPRAESC